MIAKINGIDLYYEDKGQGPALVFIHGLGENAESWKYQIDVFSKSFRTIVMDLRGHYRSGDGDEFITMELFAKDVLALLDYLGIDKAHFVGLSMGGLICQEIAIKNQNRMLTMTLSDAAGYYPEPMCTTGLDERLERIDRMPMEELGELIAKAACKINVEESILKEAIQMFQLNRVKPYRQATYSTLKADYREYHEDMNIPTFISVGQFDPVTPIVYAQYLNENIIGSKMQIIPDASHLSKMDNAPAYNLALAEFLIAYETESAIPVIEILK
ncbi:alpha/beta fold hydrolase [Clostridium brassicae]|uniref:Alpha/beta hydrolase n=1 Tax=Clostridium brassicae TaxID=2999072 RepID=A0ABT4DCX7_9CLOT|nr:alpha/beta hydrolase [Clostridium brassicae]MCY6960142.1 alpha/beta hydrolase [Clostridium brassicae]